MTVTVRQLIAETPMGEARPEVLVPTARPVSWVHSSEIYEIAPLLGGGEVLLTTGLGLVGCDAAAIRRYGHDIAARDATALVLEFGRTFVTPPAGLVDACERAELGLIVLHGVVPFVRIARVANELILDHEATRLRRCDRLTRALADDLRYRTGIQAMVATVADHAGAPVQLVDLDGRVHAGPHEPAPPTVEAPIVLASGAWGRLVAEARDDAHLPDLLVHAADALQVAIAELAVGRQDAAEELLRDLLHRDAGAPAALRRWAATTGIPVGRAVAGLVIVTERVGTRPAREAVLRTLRAEVPTYIVATAGHHLVAVVDAVAAERSVAERVADALADALAGSVAAGEPGGAVRLAVSAVAASVEQLGPALQAALEAATLAGYLGVDRQVLLPGDTALERALVRVDDATLEQLVAEVVGPLLEHDAVREPLLPTVEAYLRTGRSKAAAAMALGVRRQTVHERLRRVEQLLDVDLGEAGTTVEVALRAWRLRTAGLVQGAGVAGA